MYTVESYQGRVLNQRLVIKGFKTTVARDGFLNSEANEGDWMESNKDLKPGKYAMVGGSWLNVKGIDKALLSHV